jgi:predicted ABC-type ATPase
MQQPRLILIAGCNGSGKSTFSQSIVGSDIIPFDYDKRFLEHYNSFRDSEFREKFAIDKTTSDLENLINSSFLNGQSVCFETNFVTVPLNWIKRAKDLGFLVEIYFFCLDSLTRIIHEISL